MTIDGLVSLLLTQDTSYLSSNGVPISGMVSTRLQPLPAPDDEAQYPCIVYQSASFVEEYSDSGPVGIAKERVVFDCMAFATGDQGGFGLSRSIAFAIRNALAGFGPAALPDGTFVEDIQIVNIVGGWNDAARTLYKTSVHAMVQYQI